MTGTWAVEVGYTTSRPVIPDEAFALVVVVAKTATEAQLVACQVVATHSVMPTSSLIVDWTEVRGEEGAL